MMAFHTKLRSIDIERFRPKFLKNWETQIFQNLRASLPAVWYQFASLRMQIGISCDEARQLNG